MEENKLIDLTGRHSGGRVSVRLSIAVAGTLLLYFGIRMINMDEYGPNCANAVAFVIATIYWMIISPLDVSVAAFLIVTLGTYAKVFSWGDVTEQLGSSSFYTMLGMAIVAESITYTKCGERISYWLLYKFGKRPILLISVFCIGTSLISSFVSNVACIILMSGIANALLLNMGEKPGESRLGRALMAMIPMSALLGGCILINGAPYGNLNGLAYMNAASGEVNAAVSYADWAKISIPCFVVCIFPAIFIYTKCFHIHNRDYHLPGADYFKNKLNDLGPVKGSEWRWIIITVGMVAVLIGGGNTALTTMTFALVCLLPGIGITDAKSCLGRLPWGILLCVAMCPMIGKAISQNGVSDWLQNMLMPLLGSMSPLAFSITSMLAMFLSLNLMVNATQGALAMVISIFTPLCISLGYNPATVMLPTIFGGAFYWVFGANYFVMMNKGYGWWDMKDTILPGFLTGLICCIFMPLVNYLLTPLWGLSLYL